MLTFESALRVTTTTTTTTTTTITTWTAEDQEHLRGIRLGHEWGDKHRGTQGASSQDGRAAIGEALAGLCVCARECLDRLPPPG